MFGDDKPTCANCKVHCYSEAMRERVRDVMRYAGPRMLWRHPVLADRASARRAPSGARPAGAAPDPAAATAESAIRLGIRATRSDPDLVRRLAPPASGRRRGRRCSIFGVVLIPVNGRRRIVRHRRKIRFAESGQLADCTTVRDPSARTAKEACNESIREQQTPCSQPGPDGEAASAGLHGRRMREVPNVEVDDEFEPGPDASAPSTCSERSSAIGSSGIWPTEGVARVPTRNGMTRATGCRPKRTERTCCKQAGRSMKFKDYYAILGVERGASADAIKDAYRQARAQVSPGRFQGRRTPRRASRRWRRPTPRSRIPRSGRPTISSDAMVPARISARRRSGRRNSAARAEPSTAWISPTCSRDSPGTGGAARRQGPAGRDAGPGLRGRRSHHGRGVVPRHRSEPRSDDHRIRRTRGAAARAEERQGAHSQGRHRRAGAAPSGSGREGLPRRPRRRRLSQHRAAPAPAVSGERARPLSRSAGDAVGSRARVRALQIPTLAGAVNLKVPAGRAAGSKCASPGRGLPTPKGGAGDLYAIVQIVMPPELTERERSLLRDLAAASSVQSAAAPRIGACLLSQYLAAPAPAVPGKRT